MGESKRRGANRNAQPTDDDDLVRAMRPSARIEIGTVGSQTFDAIRHAVESRQMSSADAVSSVFSRAEVVLLTWEDDTAPCRVGVLIAKGSDLIREGRRRGREPEGRVAALRVMDRDMAKAVAAWHRDG